MVSLFLFMVQFLKVNIIIFHSLFLLCDGNNASLDLYRIYTTKDVMTLNHSSVN